MNNTQKGYSLLETMVGIGLLSLAVVAGLSIFSVRHQAAKKAVAMGEEEDVRAYVRANIDCKKTLTLERAVCSTTGSYIHGYDKNSQALVQNPTAGRAFGANNALNMKITCTDTPNSYDFDAIVTRPGESPRKVFQVPYACQKCMPISAADPYTLAPGGDGQTLAQAVRAHAATCGITIPGTAFVRHTGGTGGGFNWDDNSGTPTINTLNKICEVLGYSNYVSSTCRDSQRGGVYPNGKCNWHSPHNNDLQYYDGTNWINVHGPDKYTWTWVTSITCSGLIN